MFIRNVTALFSEWAWAPWSGALFTLDRGWSAPLFDVFQLHAAARAQTLARGLDPLKKARIMFQPEVEPVVLGLEADQNPRRFAVTGDHDLLFLRLSEKFRQIVLYLGERYFLHQGFPNCASHDSASDLATIARISTVEPDISQNTRWLQNLRR